MKILCFLLLFIPASIMAQISTDRLGFSLDPTALPTGRIQLESSFDFISNINDSHYQYSFDYGSSNIPSLNFRYGIIPNLELRAKFKNTKSYIDFIDFMDSSRSISYNGRNSNYGLGAKYQFLDKTKLSMAIVMDANVLAINKNYVTTLLPRLAIGSHINQNIELRSTLGYSANLRHSFNTLSASANVILHTGKYLGIIGGYMFSSNKGRNYNSRDNYNNYNMGILFSFNDRSQFDFSVKYLRPVTGRGVQSINTELGFSLGYSIYFSTLKEKNTTPMETSNL